MIRFTASRDESGLITHMEAKGHAGYDKYGKDILCAAVTAICATTITGLTDILQLPLDFKVEEGDIELDLSTHSYMGEDVQLLLETALLGIKQLTLNDDYADYLEVIDA